MVAISPDRVEEAAQMRSAGRLGMKLLSDVSLAVTDQYNLRHEKAITPKRGPVRPLAIPTTFFVGADGLVKWIDQAEDYRVRSDADRVLAAVREHLP
jgi:peroxiredoxin